MFCRAAFRALAVARARVHITPMRIRETLQQRGHGRRRQRWPRDVLVAAALTVAALVLSLTFVGDRSPVATSTDIARK